MRRCIERYPTRVLPALVALALLAGCSDRSLPTASDAGGDDARALRPGDAPLATVSIGPTAFQQLSPNSVTYVESTDYAVMDASGSGNISAPLVAVDIALAGATSSSNPNPTNTSTSGCEASDFAGFPPGSVALLQRGLCLFSIKIANAIAAGASAVVIFNEGQEGRTEATFGTAGPNVSVPVLSTSYALGYELYTLTLSGPVVVRIGTNTVESIATAGVNAEGTVDPITGAATVGGSLSCDGVPTIEVRVTMAQEQKARRVATTVNATDDVTATCEADGSWTATLTPASGAFVNGPAVVTAEPLTDPSVTPAEQTVKLNWSKKAK